MLRYRRNIGAIGIDGQKKLLESSAIIVGLGGLGGHVLEQIIRIGVGKIICCDGDVFDATNLNRQILSGENEIGQLKSNAARVLTLADDEAKIKQLQKLYQDFMANYMGRVQSDVAAEATKS